MEVDMKEVQGDTTFDASMYDSPANSAPLYTGSNVTVLQAVASQFLWFSSNPGISKESLSHQLSLQKSLLPANNILPGIFEAAYSFIRPFLVHSMVFHCCPRDCVVLRDSASYKYSELHVCPKCGSKRYASKTQPKKRFFYLPLGPRFARFYGTACLAQVVQSFPADSGTTMTDTQDSPMWKSFMENAGAKEDQDVRSILLQASTDGMNPFNKNKTSYSMWPITLAMLNPPRAVRYLFGRLLLLGIIPGNGAKEPGTLQPYLDILVDELLALSGTRMVDAYSCAPFQLKCSVLSFVLDYPGIGKVFNVSGSGAYRGCAWCEIKDKYL